MTMRNAFASLFGSTGLILLLACGGGGGGGGNPPPASVVVTISPTTATVVAGATQTFTPSVTGTTNTAVTWSVQEVGGGTITAGLYTAPGTGGVYHVVATSQADTSKSATATVTVTVPPATTLAYTDPTTGTYQVKRNAASNSTHLVLDVVGSGAPNGAGLAFTLAADSTRTSWAKVVGTDPEYIQNGVVFITTGVAPLKGKVSGAALAGTVGVKGTASSVALNGVLATFALDLKSGAPKGTATPTQTKAQILQADGTIANITLTFGSLSAN